MRVGLIILAFPRDCRRLGSSAVLVLVEAHVWVAPSHANLDARLAVIVIGIGPFEFGLVEDVFQQLDDIDMIMINTNHAGCFK